MNTALIQSLLVRGLALLLALVPFVAWGQDQEDADVKFQSTYIGQSKRPFSAPYSGPNSLSSSKERSHSLTATVFAGIRPWGGGELYFNPELALGVPLSRLSGLGGLTNGEMARSSGPNPTIYRARLFVRQTWGLGGEAVQLDSAPNQLAGRVDANRLVLTAGNFSALDVFEANQYSHDPRRQFQNWSLMTYGAWDYPADARGYSWGATLEYMGTGWVARAGRFLQPRESNGLALNPQFLQSYGDAAELERGYTIAGQAGKLRLLVFRNVAVMGNFQRAIDNSLATGSVPDLTLGRSRAAKTGFGISIEQSIAADVGAFARASRNDGRTETFAFTEIDRSVSAGMVVRGDRWGRPDDEAGLALARNGLSPSHRGYLARGGSGFFLGDGALNYRDEQVFETYYSYRVVKALWASVDYQRIRNPGYNADRAGPVSVWSVRLHTEF